MIKTSVQSPGQKERYSQTKWAKIGQRLGLLADQSVGEERAHALSGTQQGEVSEELETIIEDSANFIILYTFIFARTEAVDPNHHYVARKANLLVTDSAIDFFYF